MQNKLSIWLLLAGLFLVSFSCKNEIKDKRVENLIIRTLENPQILNNLKREFPTIVNEKYLDSNLIKKDRLSVIIQYLNEFKAIDCSWKFYSNIVPNEFEIRESRPDLDLKKFKLVEYFICKEHECLFYNFLYNDVDFYLFSIGSTSLNPDKHY